MPWGDETGPWWAQGRGWRAFGYPGFGRGFYSRRFYLDEPVSESITLTKEEQKKIADALVNGKAIKVEGGNYKMPVARMGRGFGRRAGGPPTVCVCPVCKNQQSKVAGLPCSQMKCSKCGSLMVRGD